MKKQEELLKKFQAEELRGVMRWREYRKNETKSFTCKKVRGKDFLF